jgi:hypothetical protein
MAITALVLVGTRSEWVSTPVGGSAIVSDGQARLRANSD